MSFVLSGLLFVLFVAQPPAPQHPTFNIGIAVNATPNTTIVQSFAITAYIIIKIPKASLKNLMKFQLLNIACFILIVELFCYVKLKAIRLSFGNKGYNCIYELSLIYVGLNCE